MRTAIVVLALTSCVLAAPPRWHQLHSGYDFAAYVKDFGKPHQPGTAEWAAREANFIRNRDAALAHNARGLTWKEGVNHMSDWHAEEFKSMAGYVRTETGVASSYKSDLMGDVFTSLPTSVDWRTKGAVTAVKDQGQCGSCWTFAASEVLESAYFLKTGVLMDLSPQQIASCTSNPKHCGGTGGCEGGTAEVAYASIQAQDGISTEWVYPYQSHAGQDFECKTGLAKPVNITGYVKLPANQAGPLMDAVASKGPIAISVDASKWGRYESGVFDGCDMTSPEIDHAVVLVGYGTDNGSAYWTVRNSWTPMWGENGYIRIAQGDLTNPECGVDSNPSTGTGCDGGPSKVTVCGKCGMYSDSCYPTV